MAPILTAPAVIFYEVTLLKPFREILESFYYDAVLYRNVLAVALSANLKTHPIRQATRFFVSSASEMAVTKNAVVRFRRESYSLRRETRQKHALLRKARSLWGTFVYPIIASRLPLVSAGDAGEDFSNNLFSDLAPILALFGEQVAKQYMSHSMTWMENLIFAMGPLGIITAITGAIRVGGPAWLKALIGRAREGNGVVEMELMSSTSSDVCELWNGNGISRVLGSADQTPVLEVIYLEPSTQRYHGQSQTANSDFPIYSFDSARAKRILERSKSTNNYERVPGEEGPDGICPPNLGINLCVAQIDNVELLAIAAVGCILQTAVIVFAALTVLYQPWTAFFKKDDSAVQSYALPFTAGGTILLVLGVFVCATIVERSTREETWEVGSGQENRRPRIMWIQRSSVVSDQQFHSYLLQKRPTTRTSYIRSALLKIPKLKKHLRSHKDTHLYITKSHKESTMEQETLSTIATVLSLCGFIIQFIGLRGMNWTVTITQLIVTAIMTALRAFIRRSLVLDGVQPQNLLKGYELDLAARELTGCTGWNVITIDGSHANDSNFQKTADSSAQIASRSEYIDSIAESVINARCSLADLSNWESQWQETVDSIVMAFEIAMNFLSTCEDIEFSGLSGKKEFRFHLTVEVSNAAVGQTCSSTENSSEETVSFCLTRNWLPEGRGWGEWKINAREKAKIAAIFSQWMLNFELLGKGRDKPLRNLRMFQINKQTYNQWILRNTERIKIFSKEEFDEKTMREVGKPLENQPSDCLPVIIDAPLERVCAQALLAHLFCCIAKSLKGPVGGALRVRAGTEPVKSSFGLRSLVLDKLVRDLEQPGLGSTEELLLTIIPPIANAGKLPTNLGTTDVFDIIAKEAKIYREAGQLEQSEPYLLWLFDAAESTASTMENEGKWAEAFNVYILLCETVDSIVCAERGPNEYVEQAEEATGLFCERLGFAQVFSESIDNATDILESTQKRLTEASRSGWSQRFKRWEDMASHSKEIRINFKAERKDFSTLPISKCIYLDDFSEGNQYSSNNDAKDTLGQTLIKATITGNSFAILRLLHMGANPGARDNRGRTAIHYATAKGLTSVLRILLLSCPTEKDILNIKDEDGYSALALALNNNDGAAAAILVFYGADDEGDQVKKCLSLSLKYGSSQAIERLLNGNEILLQEEPDLHGRTPVHWAMWRDCQAAIELIPNGSRWLNEKDKHGESILHYAAAKGRITVARELLNKDAGAEVENGRGRTPLSLAAERGHLEVVNLLLERGVKAGLKDALGRTPLLWSVENGHLEVVRLLLEKGVDPNAGVIGRRTPLSWAAGNGNLEVVELLLEKEGVDPNAVDKDGRTPISWAAGNGNLEVVELLLEKEGVDPDAKDKDGRTPISWAAGNGRLEVVKLLLEKGVDPNAKDEDGHTPLLWAAENGHLEVVKLLEGGLDKYRDG